MPDVVGIRFKACGKVYDFEVEGIDPKIGAPVVVESDFGLSIGRVVAEKRLIDAPDRGLKKVIRLVTEEDIKASRENKELEKEARNYCLERIMARGIPMKLVGTESTLDKRRVIFYFTADGRIDFRELVKDLAAKFKTRIEMRQIGVRDEAKLIGGLGICGRELCCSTFLTSFDPVSIKMAKRQELVLNVGKLSGLCGRLMCCLRYEYDGNLEDIATDDVIPIGEEDAPIEVIEKKISSVRPRTDSARRSFIKEKTGTSRQEEKISESPPPAEKEGSAEQAEKGRPHNRNRRRRFKK